MNMTRMVGRWEGYNDGRRSRMLRVCGSWKTRHEVCVAQAREDIVKTMGKNESQNWSTVPQVDGRRRAQRHLR